MAELPLRAAAAGYVAPQLAAPRATGTGVSPGAARSASARDPFYDSLLSLTPSQTAAFKSFSTR